MKTLVYESPVESEENLVARIVAAAGQIGDDPEVLNSIHAHLRRRLELCVHVRGAHFEQLLN